MKIKRCCKSVIHNSSMACFQLIFCGLKMQRRFFGAEEGRKEDLPQMQGVHGEGRERFSHEGTKPRRKEVSRGDAEVAEKTGSISETRQIFCDWRENVLTINTGGRTCGEPFSTRPWHAVRHSLTQFCGLPVPSLPSLPALLNKVNKVNFVLTCCWKSKTNGAK